MKRMATILMATMALSSFGFAQDTCSGAGSPSDRLLTAIDHLNASRYESAFTCFSAVAEEEPIAAFNLGVMLTTGTGTEKDDIDAVAWFRKAAKGGVDKAQYNLGVNYFWGYGVEQDYEEAYKWFDVAVRSGYQPAMTALRLTAFRLTPEDIAEAERSSRRYIASIEK